MKLIPKKQRGGQFSPYYAEYIPVEGPGSIFGSSGSSTSKRSSKSDGDSEKGKLTEKDLFTMMKDLDGLPNEMKAIFSHVNAMYGSANTSGATVAMLYNTTLNEIKQAKFNKEEYDKVWTEVNKNQGMGEFAVTSSGHVVVYNKDKELTAVSVDEYMQNPDKYRAITNSNILNLRAKDPQFVYRNGDPLLEIATNAIGLNKIESMLRERLQNLGTTEQVFQGYTKKQGENIQQGIKILEELASRNESDGTQLTVDGLYKDKVITKEQKNQADAAIKYIYETLPENAKAILQLHSGNANNPIQGAIRVISDLVTQGMSSTFSVTHDYESNLNPDGTKRKDPKDVTDDEKLNIAQQWLMGTGNTETYYINPGTNLATRITSSSMPIVSKDGKVYQIGDSLRSVTESQYGGMLNWNKATMGGKRIRQGYYDQVLITDNNIRLVDFPINSDGTPDLTPKTLEAVEKYRRLAEENGIDLDDPSSVRNHTQELNAILQECGLPVAFDSNGNYIQGKWAQFGVIQGVTTDTALSTSGDYSLFRDIKDKSEIDSYKRIIEKNQNAKLDFDYDDKGWFEGGYNRMLEGTIWIPIYNNIFNAGAGTGSKLDPQTMNDRIISQYNSNQYSKKQELLSRYNKVQL